MIRLLVDYINNNENSCEKEVVISLKDAELCFRFFFKTCLDFDNSIIGYTIIGTNVTLEKELEKKINILQETLKSVSWKESHLIRAPVANLLALSKIILECKDDSIEKDKYICFLQREGYFCTKVKFSPREA